MVKAADFSLIERQLDKMGPYEILHRYVPEHERSMFLAESHGGTSGGNFLGKAIAHKILRVGLWWSTLDKDEKEYCRACDVSRRIGKPYKRDEMTLVPQVTLQSFEK